MSQSFWERFGLNRNDEEICVGALRDRYEGYRVEEFEEQGYCSYTMRIATNNEEEREGDEMMVQVRPAPQALDLNITRAAKKTYPSLAPTISNLDMSLPANLTAYEMQKLPGTPLSRLLPRTRTLTAEEGMKLEMLIASFTEFVAQAWRSASKAQASSMARTTRADSPMEDNPTILSQCHGKVGSSIIHRLEKLAAELPGADLRRRAKQALLFVQHMTDYLVVLNHGDLIPSNILVNQQSWLITGVVDWAEAEFLPFGTCLYGLEHLLGYLVPASSSTLPKWVYFDDAARYRDMFWSGIFVAVPELRGRKHEVRFMRDVGVLLWHGIAWDDGAIDRVVNQFDDYEELVKLRAFLEAD